MLKEGISIMNLSKPEGNIQYNIIVPENVLFILNTFHIHGFEAFAVGGCIRDSLLGREPADWDIAASALPQDIKRLFEKSLDTGIKHGTVTVIIESSSYEITTFRVDGEYRDNRRPENVRFTSSIKDDLGRRDFTINAIAYNPDTGIVDPFDGFGDIRTGIIRTVGDAGERFKEDALRMLRAIRFSAQLGFSIESATLEAIRDNRELIKNVSRERVRDELTKTITAPNPEEFTLFHSTGLLKLIMPEFEPCFTTEQNHPYHIYNVAGHTIKAVGSVENSRTLRWAMLLHDIGKTVTKTTDENGVDHFYGHPEQSVMIAEKLLKRLRFDSRTISTVLRLIKYHDRRIEPTPRAVRRALNTIGDDIFEDLLKVKRADKAAQNPQYTGYEMDMLAEIERIYRQIKLGGHCTSIKDLMIDGDDLLKLGFKEGKAIGDILGKLLELVIEKPELNDRNKLVELARAFAEGGHFSTINKICEK